MIRTLSGVSVGALVVVLASSASAQDLMFPKGEGGFSWFALEDFAASHDYTGENSASPQRMFRAKGAQ